jgi:2-methylcitrate dehydratase
MGDQIPDDNAQQPYDSVIDDIVQYVYNFSTPSSEARSRAKAALLDALGAALESLHTSKECAALLGPVWPNTTAVPGGFRIPGTTYSVDLLKGAFDMGAMIRYLDHNDAFPGAEWGHPSGM